MSLPDSARTSVPVMVCLGETYRSDAAATRHLGNETGWAKRIADVLAIHEDGHYDWASIARTAIR